MVRYLSYYLTQGFLISLSLSQTKADCYNFAVSLAKKKLRIFLGIADFCWIWILGFGLLGKPLCKPIKAPDSEPLKENQGLNSFQGPKISHNQGLLELEKPILYMITKKQGIILEVLTQKLDNISRPMVNFSK